MCAVPYHHLESLQLAKRFHTSHTSSSPRNMLLQSSIIGNPVKFIPPSSQYINPRLIVSLQAILHLYVAKGRIVKSGRGRPSS